MTLDDLKHAYPATFKALAAGLEAMPASALAGLDKELGPLILQKITGKLRLHRAPGTSGNNLKLRHSR